MKKDWKHGNVGRNGGRNIRGNVRLLLIVLFLVFCVIIFIYDTYYESRSSDTNSNDTQLPEISEYTSIDILANHSIYNIGNDTLNNNLTNISQSTFLHNPSIAKSSPKHYYLAYIVEVRNKTSVWFSETIDGNKWQTPWTTENNFTNANNPVLTFSKNQQFKLFYEQNEKSFLRVSEDAILWSAAEPWEFRLEEESIYYSENNIFTTNSTGFWVSSFDEEISWQSLMTTNFTNASIMQINNNNFIIIHENSTNNHSSFILTTITFKTHPEQKLEPKWELMVVFVIMGIILLSIMIQEIAHK
jgi:hypothetical protein